MKKRSLFTMLLLVCIPSIVAAVPLVDQTSPFDGSGFNASDVSLNWQQQVVVGTTGLLTSIEVYANTTNAIDFYLNVGEGWQSDDDDVAMSDLKMTTIGWNTIDVSSADLFLENGDIFVIGIKGNNGGATVGGSAYPGLYATGKLYLNGAVYSNSDFSIAFNTYIDADITTASAPAPMNNASAIERGPVEASIPEPATFLLFFSGLLGLTARQRKPKS